MAVDRAALREFVTGSSKLGEYPDAQWGRWEERRRALLAECRERGVTVALLGSTAPQTHAPVPTVLADVAAQLGERWPDPTRSDGRCWSLGESIEQVRLCALALDQADRAATTPSPPPSSGGSTPSTPPAGGSTSNSWPPKGAAWWADWSSDDPRDGGKFKSTPWNYQSTSPRVVGGDLVITMPANGGQEPGQGAERGSGSRRCELEPALPSSVAPAAGRTVWHRWDLTLVNFPADTKRWNVLTQFKQDGTGSPPVELSVEAGRFVVIIHNGGGAVIAKHDLGPAVVGRATTLVLGVTFGTSGRLVGYVDGAKTLDVGAATMHSGKGSYLKSPGIYADAALAGPLSVRWSRMAVGPTRESVS